MQNIFILILSPSRNLVLYEISYTFYFLTTYYVKNIEGCYLVDWHPTENDLDCSRNNYMVGEGTFFYPTNYRNAFFFKQNPQNLIERKPNPLQRFSWDVKKLAKRKHRTIKSDFLEHPTTMRKLIYELQSSTEKNINCHHAPTDNFFFNSC